MGTPQAELSARLSSLGLDQYEKALVENGFDTWQSVLSIEETDLEALQFKLGHRRKLQREIANFRNHEDIFKDADDQEPQNEAGSRRKSSSDDRQPKRRYKRHPKRDPSAPQRPKSGYVLFSNNLRTSSEVSAMSFVDISKHVGQRWQDLGPDGRREWESKAAIASTAYQNELNEYKKTNEYEEYSQYLDIFRRKQEIKPNAVPTSPDNISADPKLENVDSPGFPDDSSNKTSSRFGGLLDIRSPLEWRINGTSDKSRPIGQALKQMANLADDEPQYVKVFDEEHLPPQAPTAKAVASFSSGIGAFIFLYTMDDITTILDHVWNNDGSSVDTYAFMDLLAMAALGSYYDTDEISGELEESFFFSCIRQLLDLKAVNLLRCMRLLLCLAIYSMLKIPNVARLMCTAAFRIGQTYLLREHEMESNPTEGAAYWRKIFRSVVLLECWFSSQLGYQPSAGDRDFQFAFAWTGTANSIEEIVQEQGSKIWALAAQIWSKLLSSYVKGDTIREFAEKLDVWHSGLPPLMQLSTLSSPQSAPLSSLQRRSILLMHLFYLSTATLLHGKALVAATDSKAEGDWDIDMSDEEVEKYREYCVIAAQQAARIASLLNSDGVTRKQWAAVYPIFPVCSVLLFSAAQRLSRRSYQGLEDELDCAKSCINLLDRCVDADSVMKFLGVAKTLHETLVTIKNRPQSGLGEQSLEFSGDPAQLVKQDGRRSSPHPLLEWVLTESRELLLDPFRALHQGKGKGRQIDGNIGDIERYGMTKLN